MDDEHETLKFLLHYIIICHYISIVDIAVLKGIN